MTAGNRQNVIDPKELDLHDANIKSVAIDFAGRTVSVVFDMSRAYQRPSKHELSLTFSGVTSLADLYDLEGLGDHAFAGNVSSWSPGNSARPTFIYLAAGTVSIRAKSLRIESDDTQLHEPAVP
jgi:hypothetical protein